MLNQTGAVTTPKGKVKETATITNHTSCILLGDSITVRTESGKEHKFWFAKRSKRWVNNKHTYSAYYYVPDSN